MMEFEKATEVTGVEPQFIPGDPQVHVTPDEIPDPLRPEDGDPFWRELAVVCRMTSKAKRGALMGGLTEHRWEEETGGYATQAVADPIKEKLHVYTAAQAAALVHDEPPTRILHAVIEWLMEDGAVPRNWHPSRPGVRFTDGVVLLYSLVGRAIREASPSAFCAKWHYMLPRPEEVMGAVARGTLDAPNWFMDQADALCDLDVIAVDQRKFTVYPEGCPGHPSYPAMHSVVGGMALALPVLFEDLTEDQIEQVKLAAVNLSFFRSFAGVHYPQDNVAGLDLGEEVLTRWLPGALEAVGTEVDPAPLLAQYRTSW